MVERMQRSTTMLSVTGYVTLALAGASQGILPEFWLETNRWSQCSDINLSRHPSPSFREVLSISSISSLSPGHVLPARAGEHDVEDWSCREQWGQVWKKHITRHWNGCRWSGLMVSLAFWFSCFLFNGFVRVLWMVSNLCLEDTDYAESHLPGLYFYLSVDLGRTTNKYSESRRVFCSFAHLLVPKIPCDLTHLLHQNTGAFVETIVSTVLGQVGGLLDAVGANVDGGISLTANQGIGFFVNTAGIGFYTQAKVSGSTTEIKCVFKFGNGKLKCKARLGWAELFLQSGKYVVRKISNFAGSGAQEIAEFYANAVGGNGQKFSRFFVNRGKKVAQKVKCKLSNLLGGSCGKSGGTPSSCGDGTEYVIKNEQDRCLQVSPDCFEPESDGKVYFYRRNCVPSFDECTHLSSSYATQMQSFWWFTRDRYLCNEYMHNMYFGDIGDPDGNPKCIRLHDQKVYFDRDNPTPFHIAKKSTERFRVAFYGVTGPYGQVCFQSSSAGSFLNQGRRRRRYWQEVHVRGYDGGRRRRRCDKGGASAMRIYQKLEPGNGHNYEKENGDAQFLRNCAR